MLTFEKAPRVVNLGNMVRYFSVKTENFMDK